MNILILSAAPNSEATQSIVKAAKKRGHNPMVKDPGFLILLISDKINGYDRLYDGYGQQDKPVRIKASEIDCVIPRLGQNLSFGCAVLEHLNGNLGIFSTQTAQGIKTASDKLISLQKLSQAKIRVPQTVLGDRAIHPAWMIDQVNGLPAIAKGLTGSQGKSVYPLESKYQTNVFLKNFHEKKDNLLLQYFVDGGGRDIRAIVIGDQVVAAMERTAAKGELRANLSQGGTGRKVTLSEADQEICIKAARACGLEVAGVDLMLDPEGRTYVIELNSNFGMQIEVETNQDVSGPLIEFCEREHKRPRTAAINQDPKEFFSEMHTKIETEINDLMRGQGFGHPSNRVGATNKMAMLNKLTHLKNMVKAKILMMK